MSRLIDGDRLMMHLADWWFSSFGEEETEEAKAIRKVMDKVEESLDSFTVPRWIPVTERLPESNFTKEYLVSQRGCEWLALASYDDGWFDSEGTVVHERVTAYMPLPQPYKEG